MIYNKKLAIEIYKMFSHLDGNKHIASEYNLFWILNYISKYNIRNILEIGVGIGTIPYLLLEAKSRKVIDWKSYLGTETNEYCLTQIEENVKRVFKGLDYQVVNDLKDVSAEYDFIIIDGSANLVNLISLLSSKTILFIEGLRSKQVSLIQKTLENEGIPFESEMRFSCWRNPTYGPYDQKYQAGHTVFFLNPDETQRIAIQRLRKLAKFRSRARKVVNFRKINTWIG